MEKLPGSKQEGLSPGLRREIWAFLPLATLRVALRRCPPTACKSLCVFVFTWPGGGGILLTNIDRGPYCSYFCNNLLNSWGVDRVALAKCKIFF